MDEVASNSRRPSALRIASATLAAGIANLFWIAGRLVACGEPPYPDALCDRGSLALPWYGLVLLAPSAVVISAFIARMRGSNILFEAMWIALVSLGFLLPLALAALD